MHSNRHKVYWGHISMLMGDLKCLHELLERNHQWNFFINQAGTAIPLMNIHEMEKKLSKLPPEKNSIISKFPSEWCSVRFSYKHVLR